MDFHANEVQANLFNLFVTRPFLKGWYFLSKFRRRIVGGKN